MSKQYHSERSAAKSQDAVEPEFDFATGFPILVGMNAATLRTERECRSRYSSPSGSVFSPSSSILRRTSLISSTSSHTS